MKKSISLKVILLSTTAFTLSALALTSCSKNNDDDVSGTAHIKVVNSVQGSTSQDLYVDGTKVTGSVAYAESSSFTDVKSGDKKAEFRNSGSADVNASFSLSLSNNKYYTVYYTAEGSAKGSFVSEEDMSAPASGKAKVRFVHLSSAAASKIDLAISGGDKFVTNLSYKAASAYSEVSTNASFNLYASGSSSISLNIPTSFESGKIYVVYITGNTVANISFHIIKEN